MGDVIDSGRRVGAYTVSSAVRTANRWELYEQIAERLGQRLEARKPGQCGDQ